MLKKLCNCCLLERGHFLEACQKKQRDINSAERELKHREWLERQKRNAIRQAEREQRQAAWEQRHAAWERRHAAWQQREAQRASQKLAETTDETSTVASEGLDDDWTAPAKGLDFDWTAPAAKPVAQPKALAQPLEQVEAPAEPVKQLKFTADEWKELLKVKKVLREIAVIDGLVLSGKKVDALQQAKLNRRTELEGCLVMYKDRAGYQKP